MMIRYLLTATGLLMSTVLLAVRSANAELPHVLIIGDSISLGYTPQVVQLLEGDAVVKHHRGNAQHTRTGIQKIDQWIGDTSWDVIHFNWGLWDLCYRHPESKTQGHRDKVRGALTTSLEQYEKNLDLLVTRLEKTGAVLIWAHTMVVPEGEAGRKLGDDLKYNAAAARVMKKHGIRINDLNSVSRKFPDTLFTAKGNVHFKPDGYRQLAQHVVQSIRAGLAAAR